MNCRCSWCGRCYSLTNSPDSGDGAEATRSGGEDSVSMTVTGGPAETDGERPRHSRPAGNGDFVRGQKRTGGDKNQKERHAKNDTQKALFAIILLIFLFIFLFFSLSLCSPKNSSHGHAHTRACTHTLRWAAVATGLMIRKTVVVATGKRERVRKNKQQQYAVVYDSDDTAVPPPTANDVSFAATDRAPPIEQQQTILRKFLEQRY